MASRPKHGISGVPFPIGLTGGAASIASLTLHTAVRADNKLLPSHYNCGVATEQGQPVRRLNTLREFGNHRLDACHCNVVSICLVADGVATGWTVLLSLSLTQQSPRNLNPG